MPPDTYCLFEPRKFEAPAAAGARNMLAKVILTVSDLDTFAAFKKNILIVRDPRDRIVSSALYRVFHHPDFCADESKVAEFTSKLRQKEASPEFVSVLDLIRLCDRLTGSEFMPKLPDAVKQLVDFKRSHPDFFIYHYEDLVVGKFDLLSEFLGIKLSDDKPSVAPEVSRVTRTKDSGDWRNWFVSEDVTYFRAIFTTQMSDLGYADDWTLAEMPQIATEHSSGYVTRLINERLALERSQTAVELRWRPKADNLFGRVINGIWRNSSVSAGTRKTKNALAEAGGTIGKTDIDPGNGALHVEHEGLLADLRTELSAETSRRRELEFKLLARTREIAQLKRSSSWLITAPMRKLGQGLRRFLAMTMGPASDDKQLIREGASNIVCSSGRHAGERDESSSQCDFKVSTTPSGVKRTQYQSLEGLTGGSDLSGKLSRLKLDQLGRGRARPLEGFSVLDLGCNEGFFCNAARELGAARIVGIDRSEDFIQRARLRFPEITFLHGSWWDLPDEQFDVILFLSAIHYEPEQKKLLDLLSTRLKPEGTLVLECGAVADDHRAPSWQAIERHDGLKRYPTFAHLRRGLLSKFAVRVIGQSVPQRGDPIPRVVLHCTPRRPLALLIHGDFTVGQEHSCRIAANGERPVIFNRSPVLPTYLR